MYKCFFTPMRWFIILVICYCPLSAQEPPARTRTIGIDPNPSTSQASLTNLSKNYKIALTGKRGSESLGALSNLTCSPNIRFSGPLDIIPLSPDLTMSGSLQEEGNLLKLSYSISLKLPQASGPKNENITYREYSFQGTVLIKPSTSYDLYQSGNVTLSVMVSPATEE